MTIEILWRLLLWLLDWGFVAILMVFYVAAIFS